MTGILLLIVGYLHTSVFFKKAVVNYCAELLTGALAKESRLTDVDLPTFVFGNKAKHRRVRWASEPAAATGFAKCNLSLLNWDQFISR